MRLSKDKTRLAVNKSLVLSGIPPEAREYRLGNRSALGIAFANSWACRCMTATGTTGTTQPTRKRRTRPG